jgi:hypothetical protein
VLEDDDIPLFLHIDVRDTCHECPLSLARIIRNRVIRDSSRKRQKSEKSNVYASHVRVLEVSKKAILRTGKYSGVRPIRQRLVNLGAK